MPLIVLVPSTRALEPTVIRTLLQVLLTRWAWKRTLHSYIQSGMTQHVAKPTWRSKAYVLISMTRQYTTICGAPSLRASTAQACVVAPKGVPSPVPPRSYPRLHVLFVSVLNSHYHAICALELFGQC